MVSSKHGRLATVISEMATDDDEAYAVEVQESEGQVNADFTIGADVATAISLQANSGVSSNGMMLASAGFFITPERAQQLGHGTLPDLTDRIRPYRNGRDLTAQPRGVLLIDLFGLDEAQVITRFPSLYQHVYTYVKPDRDQNNRKKLREIWWQFGETRKGLRAATKSLNRYIATVETAKYRIFQFVEAEVVPDHKIVAIALDDAYHLGVLSSQIHVLWALAAGSLLGPTPVYPSSRCFQPFPFPNVTPQQQAHIRELAEQLDAHRKRQQALHPVLTLTDLYNVVDKLRAGEPLTAKDQIAHQLGLASVVLSLHQQLDAAVAEAYGWPVDLPDAEILTRLVRLNHERAREEQNGLVRYLRPSYQAPDQAQATIQMPAATTVVNDTAIAAAPLPWATELAQQMQAVREAVQQAGQPLTPAQVAARFQRIKPQKVQPLLDTLAALSLLRLTEEGTYAS